MATLHKQMLTDITEAVASDVVYPFSKGNEQGFFQVKITGTATVALEGRVAANAPWLTVATYTASGGGVVPMMPQMRVNASVVAAESSVSAWISE